MMQKVNILYVHGMGGGGDSRIPFILREVLDERNSAESHFRSSSDDSPEGRTDRCVVEVVCRTYDFDPEKAAAQIAGWVEELKPALVIGESLGSVQAIRIKGIPHILVSPSLNAPVYFGYLSWLALIPGVTWLFDRIYRPKPGDRQRLHFTYRILFRYLNHRRLALSNSTASGSSDTFFAFFGTRDHYRRSGIVSIRTWKKYFGDTFAIYDGTHFMEEEYVLTMLLPKILELLNIK